MNYYMPFSNFSPYINEPIKTSLLNKIFKNGFNWTSMLTNTQKTLNIINQTIPVIKQIKPVIDNTKTMFKVMNEFKRNERPKENITQTQSITTNNIAEENIEQKKNDSQTYSTDNGPTFFV